MNQPFPEKIPGKPRILVAPLDWGLGHATRCIPLIRQLIAQEAEVWLAGEGSQENLLRAEFPNLSFITLKGYGIKYANSKTGLLTAMLRQVPGIIKSIKLEHEWLKQAVEKYGFDGLISDNRYGLWHAKLKCIFMTHQLTIKSPLGKWSESLLQNRNYRYINHFHECWVPDLPGKANLAGELSHPFKNPAIPTRWIGPLSRFSYNGKKEKPGKLLILLSGPEPQRSIFENIIINELAHYDKEVVMVRGLPGHPAIIPSTNNLKVFNHLSSDQLAEEIESAEWVISRSGYSSVMDLLCMRKKTILVPTPGQTEQEYLGLYLGNKKMILCIQQQNFSLEKSLAFAKDFHYEFLPDIIETEMQGAASAFIKSVLG